MTPKLITLLTVFFLTSFVTAIYAQPQYASTSIQKKKAIIEEFTGVRCPACPSGHYTIKNILAEFPTEVIPMAYHPAKTNFTKPYPGDPNLKHNYLDTFWLEDQAGYKAMPTATINRRTWNQKAIHSSTDWKTIAETIIQEDSPLNVGMHVAHSNLFFSVDIEVYFTNTVSDNLALYVHLIENVDVHKQKGSNISPYTLDHVFREHLNTGQWGDHISGPTSQSNLFTKTYSVLLNTLPIGFDINRARIVAFVYNKTTGEIITGEIINANGLPTSNQEPALEKEIIIFPNPATQEIQVNFTAPSSQSMLSIFNLLGQNVYSKPIIGKGIQQLTFTKNNLNVKKGLYLIRITSGNQTFASKVLFE